MPRYDYQLVSFKIRFQQVVHIHYEFLKYVLSFKVNIAIIAFSI
jgi:hypothetical protein